MAPQAGKLGETYPGVQIPGGTDRICLTMKMVWISAEGISPGRGCLDWRRWAASGERLRSPVVEESA